MIKFEPFKLTIVPNSNGVLGIYEINVVEARVLMVMTSSSYYQTEHF